MGKLKNISSALSRYQASKGFGVHSPFAFSFITNVLDEKYGYYAYDFLQQLRTDVVSRVHKEQGFKPRVAQLSELAAMFRVANYYNPPQFLAIGSSYGVGAAALLTVSSRSHAIIYDHQSATNATCDALIESYGSRVTIAQGLAEAVQQYEVLIGDDMRFVVVNNVAPDDADAAAALIDGMVSKQGVLIIRGIESSRIVKQLWTHCKAIMTCGMTFSNGKMAVIVLNPKLPRQDFEIWLS